MICDIKEFIKWKDDSNCGKVYAWVSKTGSYPYGMFRSKSIPIYFHKFISPEFNRIDHIDRNGLNNCKDNLREGDGGVNDWNKNAQSNNALNIKGVSLRKDRNKYQAVITAHGKRKYLGLFDTTEEASNRYQLAEKRRWDGLSFDSL